MVFRIELSALILILTFNIESYRFKFLSEGKTFWGKIQKASNHKKTSQKKIHGEFEKILKLTDLSLSSHSGSLNGLKGGPL